VNLAQGLAPGKRFRFKNKLFSLDATVIDLCLSLFDWAKFRQTKGAIKLHLLLDHDGYLPVFATVSEGAHHELAVARSLDDVASGSRLNKQQHESEMLLVKT
jgi:putative transposase